MNCLKYIFGLFGNSKSSLSNNNILRGFLVPMIELLSESTDKFESTFATTEEASKDVPCPEMAVAEGVSCGSGDRAT